MIPAPEDRELARTLVAVMDDTSVSPDIEADPDERWEFAMVLVAAARRAGWNPTPPQARNPSP